MARNYDKVQAAQLEFLLSRILGLRADLQPAAGAIGGPITPENASKIATTVADTLTKAGNSPLAERYQAGWDSYWNAVEDLKRAVRAEDHVVSDMALAVADDACEDFERIAAEVSTWLDGLSRKGGA